MIGDAALTERRDRARRRRWAVAALAVLQRELSPRELSGALGERMEEALADAESAGQAVARGTKYAAAPAIGPEWVVVLLETREVRALLPRLLPLVGAPEPAFLLALAADPLADGRRRAVELRGGAGPLRSFAGRVLQALGDEAAFSAGGADEAAPVDSASLGPLARFAYAALASAANQLFEADPGLAQQLVAIGMDAAAFEGHVAPAQGILALAVTRALYDLGQYDEAIRFSRTAQRALEAPEGAVMRAWLQFLEGHVLADRHRLREAQEVLSRVDLRATALGQLELSGVARTALGTLAFREGRAEAAVQLFESALERVTGTGRFEAAALHCLGHAYVKLGRWVEARELIAGTLAGLDSVAFRLSGHVNAVICDVMLGSQEAASERVAAVTGFAPPTPHGRLAVALARGWERAGAGQWEAAVEAVAPAQPADLAERPSFAVAIDCLRAFALARLRRLDEAAQALERAAHVLKLKQTSRNQPVVHLLDAEISAGRGDPARARRALRRLREFPEHARLWDLELRARLIDARIAEAEGDPARAGRARLAATEALERLRTSLGPAHRDGFERTLDRAALLSELGVEAPAPDAPLPWLRGRSPAFRATVAQLGRVARSRLSVLLLGETGSGKELLARAVHQLSDRSGGPFVALNCAALTDELLLSELFGHEPGAFTGAEDARQGRFEEAHGGTLFLDEVGELSPRGQAALLRALQEGTFERVGSNQTRQADVRVVAATHRDLDPAGNPVEFRADLYFRLAAAQVTVPPLRERGDDVLELTQHFLAESAGARGAPTRELTDEARELLRAYRWPGNVRELKNVIRAADLLAEPGALAASTLRPLLRQPAGAESTARSTDHYEALRASGGTLRAYLDAIQRDCVRGALRRHDGNLTRAAEELGLSRSRVSELVLADPELQRLREASRRPA